VIGSLSFFRLLVDGTAVVAEGGVVEVEGAAAAAAVEKKAEVAGAVVGRWSRMVLLLQVSTATPCCSLNKILADNRNRVLDRLMFEFEKYF
jgi:hypothetical protein